MINTIKQPIDENSSSVDQMGAINVVKYMKNFQAISYIRGIPYLNLTSIPSSDI